MLQLCYITTSYGWVHSPGIDIIDSGASTEYDISVEKGKASVGGVDVVMAKSGTVVTVKADPPSGMDAFFLWEMKQGGVVLDKPGSSTATFTMPSNPVVLKATYKPLPPPPPQITGSDVHVLPTENGTAIADKTTDVDEGEEVSVTVTPAPGYAFAHVIVTKTGQPETVHCTYAGGKCIFTMPNCDVDVKVTFQPKPPSLYNDVHFDITGSGQVELNKSKHVPKGHKIVLKLVPDPGHKLDWLTIVRKDSLLPVRYQKVNEQRYTFEMPDEDVQISGAFSNLSEPSYDVTILPSPNGAITADRMTNIEAGKKMTLRSIPLGGYKLKTLVVARKPGLEFVNCNKINENTYEFIMPSSNVEVGAVF